MILKLRKHPLTKAIALLLICSLVFEIYVPNLSYSQTSGPIQRENIALGNVGDSEYVDLYSGDFNYNIPLLAIPGPNGGYPISLNYNSDDVKMDTEASWVGLGWNLNIGAVTREMRGLPDDFSGETVETEYNFNTINDISFKFNRELEFLGYPQPAGGSLMTRLRLNYNDYYGFGFNYQIGRVPSIATIQLGLSLDSQNGLTYSGSRNLFGTNYQATGTVRQGLTDFNTSREYSIVTPKLGFGFGFTSSKGFRIGQSLPSINLPSSTNTFSGTLSTGDVAFFGDYDAEYPNNIAGTYTQTTTSPSSSTLSQKAYGYIFNEYAKEVSTNSDYYNSVLKDVNRQSEEFIDKTPNLPPSSFSNDNFIVSGQGIGGVFRAHQGKVCYINTPFVQNVTSSNEPGVEVGVQDNLGVTNIHGGYNSSNSSGLSLSGMWDANDANDLTTLIDTENENLSYERVYFKMIDETNGSPVTGSFYEKWGGDQAIRSELQLHNNYEEAEYKVTNQITTGLLNSPTTLTSNDVFKEIRQTRNNHIQIFNRTEAGKYGKSGEVTFHNYIGATLSTDDLNDTENSSLFNTKNKLTDVYSGLYANQISEINITQTDGSIHTFGLPVYNRVHKEVIYSEPEAEVNNEIRKDVSSSEYLNNVTSGRETQQYKKITALAPYVTSWLITSVQSDDFIDVTNNGPSDDDLGYWVKFNYRRLYTNYKWRTPYDQGMFIGGKKGDHLDNMNSFSYGEKDVVYIETIETKTHIAKFYISLREDAIEADGMWVNSGQGDNKLCKLDSIALFVKSEFQNNENAIPIQTVHLTYDYSLCQGIENGTSGGGKLTLKSVHFTSENSDRGEKSPYQFSYVTEWSDYASNPNLTQQEEDEVQDLNMVENPSYEIRNIDRWGNYVPFTSMYTTGNGNYPYSKFPYTPQEAVSTSEPDLDYRNAAPWALRKIITPTGSIMRIKYEADDYAYVETEKAMEMFDIIDVDDVSNSKLRTSTPGEFEANLKTYTGSGYRVYFKLNGTSVTNYSVDGAAYIKNKILRDLEDLYFRVDMHMLRNEDDDSNSDNDVYEEVAGYCKVKNDLSYCGMISSDIGYITVDPVFPLQGDVSVLPLHPFRKAAFQLLKLDRSELIYANEVPPSGGLLSQVGALFTGFFGNVTDIITVLSNGFINYCAGREYASEMHCNGRSKIRMYNPTSKKIGGGYRVKKITFHDNWLSTNPDAEYGMEYFYDSNGNGTGISTGVAYEPITGGDEDALRQPTEFQDSHPLRTSYDLYTEKPVMGMFYPGVGVGYSKVTVRSLAPKIAEENGSKFSTVAAPYSVTEFYTPKNFPVWFDETDLTGNPPITREINIPGMSSLINRNNSRAQGYSIVLNNMSGKLKKISTYKRFPFVQQGNLISSTEYVYQTTSPYNENGSNYLETNLPAVITSLVDSERPGKETLEKEIIDAHFGIEEDVWFDFHQNSSRFFSNSLETNLELQFNTFLIFPSLYLKDYEESSSFKWCVANKVIRKTGMLKEVISYDEGSINKMEVVAYDYNTGEPIITSTNNEFDNLIYSHSYKGYWNYSGMNGKFNNSEITIDASSLSETLTVDNGIFEISNDPVTLSDYFQEGDMVWLESPYSSPEDEFRAFVLYASSTLLKLIDEDGNPIDLTGGTTIDKITVISSGYKNLYDVDCGNLVAGNFDWNIGTGDYSFSNIIDASAVKYRNEWETFNYDCSANGIQEIDDVLNPFLTGAINSFAPSCSYKYLTNRTYNGSQQSDGYYSIFNEFEWLDNNSSNWILQGVSTLISPFGYALEQKKSLSTSGSTGIYAASEYSYNNQLLSAQAQNARYSEIFSSSFEDYYPYTSSANSCKYLKLDFYNNNPSQYNNDYVISTDEKHTGNQSLKLLANKTIIAQSFLSNTNGTGSCDVCDDVNNTFTEGTFKLAECSLIPKLDLKVGNKYIISAWVKSTLESNYTYNSPSIIIEFYNGSTILSSETVTVNSTGKIIDSWQRMYESFTVPASTTNIKFKLNTGDYLAYFDDLRIQPFNSEMITYVYDTQFHRIKATLDGENYATFYSYDEGGILSKMHKETTDGIKTITETRNSIFKNQ